MNLSELTKNNIKLFNYKSSYKISKNYSTILKKFYNEIKLSKDKVDKTCFFDVNNGLILEKANLTSSIWLPNEIKNYIDITDYYLFKYSKKIDNKFYIDIKIYLEENDLINLDNLRNYIKLILIWFVFIVNYSNKECYSNISVILYLTDFKKILPESSVDVLEPFNVNTGYTTRCSQGNITIYRKEEWLKVLIHESMHYLGLDFGVENHNLNAIFPIDTEISLAEAYVEFWARIFNIYFTSFNLTIDKSYNEFKMLSMYLMDVEKEFSLNQCDKVLKFMGLSYNDLIGKKDIHLMKRKLYKERTNVFSYYILTCILMNDPVKFIIWCKNNNLNMVKMNLENISKFEEYIKNNYKSETLLSGNKKLFKNLNNSLRMTIVELV